MKKRIQEARENKLQYASILEHIALLKYAYILRELMGYRLRYSKTILNTQADTITHTIAKTSHPIADYLG
jgi:hypothetical protein